MKIINLRNFIKKILYPGLDVGLRCRLKRIKPYIRKGSLKTLDIGCGNAAFTLASLSCGNSAIGVDGDKKKLDRCLNYFKYLGADKDKYKFIEINIYKLKDLNEKFDQIFLFETLEHLMYDEMAMSIISSLLNKNGILHVSTPYRIRKPYYDEYITDIEDGGHIRLGYTVNDIQKMFLDNGLKPISSDEFFGKTSQLRLNLMNIARLHFGRCGYVAAYFLTIPVELIAILYDPGPDLFVYASAVKEF